MKIGIFDPYLDSLGGGERYMLSVASCLSKQNEVFLFWEERKILEKAEIRFGLDLSAVKTSPNIFSSKVNLLQRLRESRKYDLIFYLSDGSLPFVMSNLFIHFQFPVEWVKNNFLTQIKMFMIKKVICNSGFTKNYIDKKFRINSFVLYPPVLESESMADVKKENIILTVGRFGKLANDTSFKKHEFLVEVFKEMVDNGLYNWNLEIAVSFRQNNKKEIEDFRKTIIGYPIKLLENISWSELRKVYKKTKIYWHAAGYGEDLKKFPERAEHFGITTVEAMSYGAVPVAVKAGGQIEIVSDYENGFFYNNKKELIEKTTLLTRDRNAWYNMSQKAIERSRKFSGNRFCLEVNKLFK